MNEIDTQIATLLDDVASTINPTPNFEAILTGGGAGAGSVGGGGFGGAGRPFRRVLAIAAASVVVLGGAAAAFQLDGDDTDMVATETVTEPSTTEPAPSTTAEAVASDDERTTPESTAPADELGDSNENAADDGAEAGAEHSARLGDGKLAGDPVIQVVLGTAAPGERVEVATEYGEAAVEAGPDGAWTAVLELHDVPPATLVPIRVSFADADDVFELEIHTPVAEEPDPEPPATTVAEDPVPETTEPKQPDPVEFTAKLGPSYNEAQPMKQVLFGTATPGTRILATSAYGHVTVYAGEKGNWEAHLLMYEVPGGTNVRITATASGFPQEYEFWVERPASEPQPIAFTADLTAAYPEANPMKAVLHGRGTPGSEVRAGSEYGVAEAVVGEKGNWELVLEMHEVPAGTTVGIRVTNTKSESVYEFAITKAGAPSYELRAEAAFVECDSTPPFNEYWGTATPGATITINSPYGGKQVTAGELGKWEARVEFPDAPVGTMFEVSITSSKDGGTKVFPFKRVEAV